MQLSRVKFSRALAQCDNVPDMSSHTLTDAPGVGQSVAQVLHNTDERAKARMEDE